MNDQQYPPIPGMAFVPAGWFLMGATDAETQIDVNDVEEDYLRASRPLRRVYLPAFYIDKFPITYSDYKEFIDATGYDTPYWEGLGEVDETMRYDWNRQTRTFRPGLERHPIVCITWYDAVAYSDWVGKRLPTEAEWEKAARGLEGQPYPWGWDSNLEKYCCVLPEGYVLTNPALEMSAVDAYPLGASPFGCYDMLGNCEEWCSDWYEETYHKSGTLLSSAESRPDVSKRFRSVRGCGRYWAQQHVALRGQSQPWHKNRGTSFRCALSAPQVSL